IEMIHDKGCKVALSYHDFDGMPEAQDIVRLIMGMAGYGADMFKVAAMSHSKEDSTALLKATAYLTKKEIGPVVTMAMGPEGVITRIVGGKYGSVMTFASVGQASAPGQISADIMKKKLDEFYGE
ncbi:MAG: type I 3-dehydroquinate dehydratase, partial [Eubacterium sp.]|nr:type I 3-dehydroquinate dehydratase [Candidatus Colimonas fimequi]